MTGIDVETLRWVALAYFSGAFILTIFSFNLFIIQKQVYLKKWFQFWLMISLSYLILYFAFVSEIIYLYGLYSALIILASYFFYIGSTKFLEIKPIKKINLIFSVIILLIIISTFFASLIPWTIMIAYLTYAFFLFIVGQKFIKRTILSQKIIGILIIIFSINTFFYPFIGNLDWFMPWGYMIFGMLGLLMGISLFHIHFQRQNNEFLLIQNKLQYLVHHDPLTQVYNRSFINDEFDIITKKEVLDVGLLFIDLNNFKQVNDEMGHRKGDEVLVNAAKALNNICKPRGLVSRFGGDEFLVIFYNTTNEEVSKYKQKIIDYGKNILINNIKVEFAAGYSIRKSIDEDIHNLLDVAEKAMYQNKDKQKSNS